MAEVYAHSINLRDSEGNMVPLSDWKIGDFIANIAEGGIGGGGGGNSGIIGNGYTLMIKNENGKVVLYAVNNETGDQINLSEVTGAEIVDQETGEKVSYSIEIDTSDPNNPVLKITDGEHTWTVGQGGLAGTTKYDPNTGQPINVSYSLIIDDSDPNNPILKISNGTTTFIIGGNGIEGGVKYDPQTGEPIKVYYHFIIDDTVNPPELKIVDQDGNQYSATSSSSCKVKVSETEPDINDTVFWVRP